MDTTIIYDYHNLYFAFLYFTAFISFSLTQITLFFLLFVKLNLELYVT